MLPDIRITSLSAPDETRPVPGGRIDVARFPSGTVSRSTLEPGWRWSEHVGAAQGLQWCPVPHLGYVIAGAMIVRTPDGVERRYGAGDAFAFEPGHDVWVDGAETYVSTDVAPAKAL